MSQSGAMRFHNRQSTDRTAGRFHTDWASAAGRVAMTGCIEGEGGKMHSEARSERGMGIPAWPLTEKGAKQSQFWQDVTICRTMSSVQS